MQTPEMRQLESEFADVIFEPLTPSRPAPRPNPRPEPREPARTVVPFLPVPAYREQHEAEFERSLEYVQVQIKILKALEENDTILDPKTAYEWTLEIAPQGEMPEPVQALRLCYYMRSHGYDTYALFKKSDDPEYHELTLRLLLVDPKSEKRGVGHDFVYWVQDCDTADIIHEPYKVMWPESVTAEPVAAEPVAATSEHVPVPPTTADDDEFFYFPPSAHTGVPAATTSEHVPVPPATADDDEFFYFAPAAQAGVPRLRGGEAAEHYRYSLSSGEVDPERAGDHLRIFILADIREIMETIRDDPPHATRDTQ